MICLRFRIATLSAIVALAATFSPAPASAQGRLKSVEEGDGRIHGAPTIQVTEMDLHPGQVQTLNLNPRMHAVLEFPYPVARIDAGDPEVFSASIIGNKITLKATKLSRAETSMSVILGDADLTVVPFLVRADSTQPFSYVIRYTDPLSKHLNAAEAAIAERLKAENDTRVADLAEVRLQQRLLLASDVVHIGKRRVIGEPGERFGIEIQNAQQMSGPDGRPRLYIRYKVLNQTVVPLSDLYFVVRIDTHKHRFLFFDKTVSRELYDVQDVRLAS
ncbi:MAG TPA: hypothetical protein VF190_08840, partial [Rhodothermales bacterium]